LLVRQTFAASSLQRAQLPFKSPAVCASLEKNGAAPLSLFLAPYQYLVLISADFMHRFGRRASSDSWMFFAIRAGFKTARYVRCQA
jgi:hypothetical protein